MQSSTPMLSVVVPVYNEVQNLEPLHRELGAALGGSSHEIIYVDDGSTDGSWELLKKLASAPDSTVTALRLRRNFGQTAALAAAFDAARGEVIVAMDADLQNDPADIPRLLEKIKEGYEVVSGWRARRQDNFITRI